MRISQYVSDLKAEFIMVKVAFTFPSQDLVLSCLQHCWTVWAEVFHAKYGQFYLQLFLRLIFLVSAKPIQTTLNTRGKIICIVSILKKPQTNHEFCWALIKLDVLWILAHGSSWKWISCGPNSCLPNCRRTDELFTKLMCRAPSGSPMLWDAALCTVFFGLLVCSTARTAAKCRQNLSFATSKSPGVHYRWRHGMKLLRWWKSLRGRRGQTSSLLQGLQGAQCLESQHSYWLWNFSGNVSYHIFF